MGAGGIMLAAAMFAGSVTPDPRLAQAGHEEAGNLPPQTAAPAPVPQSSPVVRPAPVVFPDSGDEVFGAPMIETTPAEVVDTAGIAPLPNGEQSESNGRQFNAQPGRSYPIPR